MCVADDDGKWTGKGNGTERQKNNGGIALAWISRLTYLLYTQQSDLRQRTKISSDLISTRYSITEPSFNMVHQINLTWLGSLPTLKTLHN